MKYHYPRLVDLNYPRASSTKAKLVNWETLNKKVLKKLGVKITKNEINDIINSKPNTKYYYHSYYSFVYFSKYYHYYFVVKNSHFFSNLWILEECHLYMI